MDSRKPYKRRKFDNAIINLESDIEQLRRKPIN
jgi:hypothetical protein